MGRHPVRHPHLVGLPAVVTPKVLIERIKAGDNLKKAWPKTNALITLLELFAVQLAALQEAVTALRQSRVHRRLYPFCIYELPWDYRSSPGADDWRKVRVRAGTIFINGQEVAVTGTDLAEDPYDGDLGDISDFSADILCDAATEKYWFWIVITDPTGTPAAAIAHGATPPTWDTTHIPIGWVDTDTDSATKELAKRQFITSDLFTIVCE